MIWTGFLKPAYEGWWTFWHCFLALCSDHKSPSRASSSWLGCNFTGSGLSQDGWIIVSLLSVTSYSAREGTTFLLSLLSKKLAGLTLPCFQDQMRYGVITIGQEQPDRLHLWTFGQVPLVPSSACWPPLFVWVIWKHRNKTLGLYVSCIWHSGPLSCYF